MLEAAEAIRLLRLEFKLSAVGSPEDPPDTDYPT